MNQETFKHQLSVFTTRDLNVVMAQFETYLRRLIEVNQVMNLTAITDPQEVYEKHFLDSCLIANKLKTGAKIADVGSGAGFPGLCLAIIRDDLQVTLIEPTTKRCVFLQSVIDELGLTNVEVLNQRAEELIQLRETFDVVTARAVAQLSILLELCVPLIKVDGLMIAMKGQKALEELTEAQKAIELLSLTVLESTPITLPSAGLRVNLVFQKTKPTKSYYPRAYNQIKKNPL
jgi:16S rRNA (guanine527-N7)-methyltransferase